MTSECEILILGIRWSVQSCADFFPWIPTEHIEKATDFESFDDDGVHNTPEGVLLKSVLQFGVPGNS